MFSLIIFLICIFVALGAGILAAWSDFRTMTIPNWHSSLVLGAFFMAYVLLWLLGREDVFDPFLTHCIGGLIVFGVTAALFALKVIGAADSKLASAYAFWVGLHGIMIFLFYMAAAGGILGILSLVFRKWKPFRAPPEGSWIDQVQAGESKVPYGIAIMLGGLASFVKLGYFGKDILGSFVLS